MRRGTFRDETVDYAAVGATQAPDLMHYPPERSIPAEESWRIGSGEARFESAGDALLSWAAQRGAGLDAERCAPCGRTHVLGRQLRRRGQRPRSEQARGRSALRHRRHAVRRRGHDDPRRRPRARACARTASCASSSRSRSRAGSVSPSAPSADSVVSGEESFILEWYDNDEVWFTVRAFDAPSALLYRVFPALVRRRRRELFTRYLRAISPLYATPA